ncbi:hypothetical protein LX32DRAFT_412257 [Colletotrichum zoysiae]|uniref:Uncharacterized protein n=1 Tax=Colletotrichum zoysiae TaxID=1216348 RepID=A0AAD9HHP4_9PEZI|nr:hypothetical protein LX32DRAFT_412257 [Colletotrichum zoysiae]
MRPTNESRLFYTANPPQPVPTSRWTSFLLPSDTAPNCCCIARGKGGEERYLFARPYQCRYVPIVSYLPRRAEPRRALGAWGTWGGGESGAGGRRSFPTLIEWNRTPPTPNMPSELLLRPCSPPPLFFSATLSPSLSAFSIRPLSTNHFPRQPYLHTHPSNNPSSKHNVLAVSISMRPFFLKGHRPKHTAPSPPRASMQLVGRDSNQPTPPPIGPHTPAPCLSIITNSKRQKSARYWREGEREREGRRRGKERPAPNAKNQKKKTPTGRWECDAMSLRRLTSLYLSLSLSLSIPPSLSLSR